MIDFPSNGGTTSGYVALAPDLYHGTVTRAPDEAGKLLMAMNVAQAEKDLRGAVDCLRERTGRSTRSSTKTGPLSTTRRRPA